MTHGINAVPPPLPGRAGGRSINPTSTTIALIGVAQFSISTF
jgi:hypothetical protein